MLAKETKPTDPSVKSKREKALGLRCLAMAFLAGIILGVGLTLTSQTFIKKGTFNVQSDTLPLMHNIKNTKEHEGFKGIDKLISNVRRMNIDKYLDNDTDDYDYIGAQDFNIDLEEDKIKALAKKSNPREGVAYDPDAGIDREMKCYETIYFDVGLIVQPEASESHINAWAVNNVQVLVDGWTPTKQWRMEGSNTSYAQFERTILRDTMEPCDGSQPTEITPATQQPTERPKTSRQKLGDIIKAEFPHSLYSVNSSPQGKAFDLILDQELDGTIFEDWRVITRYSLLTMFFSTGGESWKSNRNWRSSGNECNWYGIECKDNIVIKINLSTNDLEGTIPEEIYGLKEVEVLDFSNNQISSIPTSIELPSTLDMLFLHNNELSGTIPEAITGLYENFVVSNIPVSEISITNSSSAQNRAFNKMMERTLKNKQNFVMGERDFLEQYILSTFYYSTRPTSTSVWGSGWLSSQNQCSWNYYSRGYFCDDEGHTTLKFPWSRSYSMTGSLPPEVGYLTRLTSLILEGYEGSYNYRSKMMTGSIPNEIGKLTNLRTLSIKGNDFTGSLPEEIDELTALTTLLIYENQNLTGSIPENLCNNAWSSKGPRIDCLNVECECCFTFHSSDSQSKPCSDLLAPSSTPSTYPSMIPTISNLPTITPMPSNTEGTLRLVGGSVSHEGRVEMYYNGEWGTICGNYYFDSDDATVICNQLGYNGYIDFGNGQFGAGSGNIFMRNLFCSGSESNLLDCSRSYTIATSRCYHSDDAGVKCRPTTASPSQTPTTSMIPTTTEMPSNPDGKLRLVGGSVAHEGRVEIYYDGEWGTVCNDNFDMNDANVICNQLGYNGAERVYSSEQFGQGSGRITLDDLACTGSEAYLLNCQHNGMNIHNCGHDKDAGVKCQI